MRVSGGRGVAYEAWPVTQGVPFADGELERGAGVVVVDEGGKPLPTQTRCLATWNKDLKCVKWLLVDFQAELPADRERTLFLQRSADASPAPAQPVRVDRQENVTIVDTGALRVTLRSRHPYYQSPAERDFLARCEIRTESGWRDVLCGERGFFLYMKDQHGNLYDTCTAGPRALVTVEEAGPLRACIRIDGWHAAQDGAHFCPFILRLHFFAGRSEVRVHHTFIFDQEAHTVELSAIGIRLRPQIGEFRRAAIGGEARVHAVTKPGKLRLLQSTDREYAVSGGAKGRGARSAGWATLSGAEGSVTASVRDHWQEYPKGFAIATDSLDVQIWPETHAEPLRFTTPFEEQAILFRNTRDESQVQRLLAERPTAPLNLKSLGINTEEDFQWVERIIEKYAQGRTITHNDTGCDNGVGAAKTTEVWLRFSATSADDAGAQAMNAAVQEPLIAPADAAHTCATRALGHYFHAGDPRFEKVDAGLDDILRVVAVEPIEKCRLYGMMRYGNMVCSHAPGPSFAYVHYKDTDPERALRYVGPYNNESNDQIGAVWGNFVRTGRRDHYFLAQRYSRNVADVGSIHAHPGDPDTVGLMHYHNCHQWSGGGSPSHTLASGLLMDYFFTGNQRLLDVAREYADWVVRTQEPCGIVSCRYGVLHREFTGPLWNLMEVYEATWEEKYGELARRTLNWFLRTLPEPGNYPVSIYTRGDRGDEAVVEAPGGCTGHARDLYSLFMAAHRLFGSRALREHILAEVDHYVWEDLTDNFVTAEAARRKLTPRSKFWAVDDRFYWTQWGAGAESPRLLCMAYEMTGDPVYAAYAKDKLMGAFVRQAERVRRYGDFRFTWICFGSIISGLMRTVADAMEKDPAGLARAEQEWRRKRAELGLPVYDGPGIDFSRDRMDANGNITNRPPASLPCEAPPRPRDPVTNLGRLSLEDHPQ